MTKYVKYTRKVLEEAVSQSTSYAGMLRYLGLKQSGGNQGNIKRHVQTYKIDISHFTGQSWNKGKQDLSLRGKEYVKRYCKVLPEGSRRTGVTYLRKAMTEYGMPYLCVGEGCPDPSPTWAGKPLRLQVDHIDGDWLNNQIGNLRFLCPNCHSQTETWSIGVRKIEPPTLCACGNKMQKRSKTCAECVKASHESIPYKTYK